MRVKDPQMFTRQEKFKFTNFFYFFDINKTQKKNCVTQENGYK